MKNLLSLPIIIIDLLWSLSIAFPRFIYKFFIKGILPEVVKFFQPINEDIMPGKLIQMNVDPAEGLEDEDSMREPEPIITSPVRTHYAEAGFL